MTNSKLSLYLKIALLGAVAFILMSFDFSVPFIAPFIKMDFSDLPALIGGFSLGPLAAILISAIKNILHFSRTSTAGVGEAANFLISVAFTFPAAFIYSKVKGKFSALIGMIIGTLVMVVVAAISNYYILIPAYSKFIPIETIIQMCNAINSNIHDITGYIYFMIIPFNLAKGILVSIVTFPIYKRISKHLKK